MVSPYNSGQKKDGGSRHSTGGGKSQFFQPLDSDSGTGTVPLFRPNAAAPLPDKKKQHLRPNWSPGWSR